MSRGKHVRTVQCEYCGRDWWMTKTNRACPWCGMPARGAGHHPTRGFKARKDCREVGEQWQRVPLSWRPTISADRARSILKPIS